MLNSFLRMNPRADPCIHLNIISKIDPVDQTNRLNFKTWSTSILIVVKILAHVQSGLGGQNPNNKLHLPTSTLNSACKGNLAESYFYQSISA